MGSRGVPISSSSRQQQQQQHAAHANTAFQSSLDLVFSFSRSNQFFGENLPSGPSFVDADRFPRSPARTYDDDDERAAGPGADDDEVGPRRSSDRDRTDDEAEDTAHDAEDWEGDELDGAVQPWDGLGTSPSSARRASEQLPPNAVVRGRTPQRQPRDEEQPVTGDLKLLSRTRAAQADERTPLLDSAHDSAAAQHALESGASIAPHPRALDEVKRTGRRRSTFSREAWKAAIEEHRGESTWDTAKMLAAMMRQDRTSATYADVLIHAYGSWTRPCIYALFLIELVTFSVATVTLFADSMSSLFPKFSPFFFKLLAYTILLPTTYLPLRFLSLTSLLGIMSSAVLLVVLISDGAIKREAPGSLWNVMPTSVLPRWKRFPLSFGLLMSGFSGHAVVPSLYRDMAHPEHFNSMIDAAYLIAFSVSIVFAVLGYLMFGNSVSSEVTRDLAGTPGFPVVLNKLAVWMVAINPLVKYAIANKPLVQTFEHLIGLHPAPQPAPPRADPPAPLSSDSAVFTSGTTLSLPPTQPGTASSSAASSPDRTALASHERRLHLLRYFLLRPLTTVICVALAIIIPDFDRVLAFLGSASAFVICVIGPVGAYLLVGRPSVGAHGGAGKDVERAGGGRYGSLAGPAKNAVVAQARAVHNGEVERRERKRWKGMGAEELVVVGWERALCWVLLIVSIALATVGTVWSFLPLDEGGLQ
ncbi:hypothetical protein Rhopal_003175-T1 [Rhodotorula paludigena]|uniref:Amino acid transporter transmembrane domain-containing protein n=1 Tax=Rhodotorula paludigena TaxID=86838 RepID=A0AAV5GKY3_9BASI|nr:hypothetical protein Rhopal_003175-T1 [Rhodotorula paludigena]